jgi:polyisoprenyl-teichoic acid--peptidoglycan teichoic acid transferase
MKKRRYKKDDFDTGKSLPPMEDYESTEILEDEPPKKGRVKRFLLSVFLIIFAFISVLVIWNAINISRAADKMFGSGNLTELVFSDGLQKAPDGRVNMLIVGYSVDDPGHQGAELTDSIMVLSMDPDSKTGYMLSIPRDLYIKIPDNGYGKINEVYRDGGMDMLERIITDKLGLEINYSMVVNYTSVREMVNALGGITVTIKSSDERGLYDPNISVPEGGPLQLANGPQHLNGQEALNLTRARGSAYGSYGFPRADLTRIEHQKQVFAAIKEKASDWKVVLNPRKNGQLFDAAANNLKTDLEIGEALPFFRLFASIPNSKLQPYGLNAINGQVLLKDYSGGLIPIEGLNDYSEIKEIVKDLK